MKIIKEIKQLFKRPSAQVLIIQEIEEAKASLLEAMTGKDYACAMVDYHLARIERLKKMIREEQEEKE